MIAPARRAAFRALLAVGRDRQDSASAVAGAREALTDPRDFALTSELVLGVLRWQAALDAAVRGLISRPLERLDLEVLTALRLGAYQRIFLTRIPARAAVDDGVSLVREAGKRSATGMVNAVLRRIDPETARQAWPSRPATASAPEAALWREPALEYLATTLSHPRWLVERWLDRAGFEGAEKWAQFDNTPAPLTMRPVRWHGTRDQLADRLAASGVTTAPAAYAPDALVVTAGQPLQTPLADEGWFVLQDEASQLVAQLVADLRPSSFLDLCASPGGKTTYVRGFMRPSALLVACDLRPRRIDLLRATLARLGAGDVDVVRADARRPAPFAPVFDVVLLDAPCSGLGTIRREPEVRWRRTAADLEEMAGVQRAMLTNALAAVKPGGRVVYATCSSEPEENEQVVEAVLARESSTTRLERERHPWRGSPLEAVVDVLGDFRTSPHLHGLEAFYAAVLVRRA